MKIFLTLAAFTIAMQASANTSNESQYHPKLVKVAKEILGIKLDHLYTGLNHDGKICQIWTDESLTRSLNISFNKAISLYPHPSEYVKMYISDFHHWDKSKLSEKYTYKTDYEKYSLKITGNELIAESREDGECTINLQQSVPLSKSRYKFQDIDTIPSDSIEYTTAVTKSFDFIKIPKSVKPGQEFEFEVITKLSEKEIKYMSAFGFRMINSKGQNAFADGDKLGNGEIILKKRYRSEYGEVQLSHEFKTDFGPSTKRLSDGNFHFKLKGRVPNFDINGQGDWKLEVGALESPAYNDFYNEPLKYDEDVIIKDSVTFKVTRK